ncbi:MAG: SDR family oxidoreductase [Chloroflexi bacterium]|nr:SDR family oxidoreductase [Chloroflexota bacterium]
MSGNKSVSEQSFRHQFVVICGGSKGIGRATARLIVQQGGNVCIIARNQGPLQVTVDELNAARASSQQWVESIAADTTDMEALRPALEGVIARRGVPDYLINAVGYAYPQYIEKLTLDDFKRNMDVNYYGQLIPTLILLPHFMQARKGHIANVSSVLGYMGLIGYATYTPSKYAIVGLTESLRHELKPYNIHFSILFPPDTDTPGFAIENQSKPPETAMLSETAKLMTAEQVAGIFVRGLLRRQFEILPGEARWIRLIFRLAPGLGRWFIDRDLQKARRRLGK